MGQGTSGAILSLRCGTGLLARPRGAKSRRLQQEISRDSPQTASLTHPPKGPRMQRRPCRPQPGQVRMDGFAGDATCEHASHQDSDDAPPTAANQDRVCPACRALPWGLSNHSQIRSSLPGR